MSQPKKKVWLRADPRDIKNLVRILQQRVKAIHLGNDINIDAIAFELEDGSIIRLGPRCSYDMDLSLDVDPILPEDLQSDEWVNLLEVPIRE